MLGFSFSCLTAWGGSCFERWCADGVGAREGKGREQKGQERKGRERKGKEGTGRERKGKEGKGRERTGKEGKEMERKRERERKGTEGTGKERKGKEGKGRERKGKKGKERERKGKDGKGRERKGKEGKGRERKGKEGKERRGWFGNQPPSHDRAQMSMLGFCAQSLIYSVRSWNSRSFHCMCRRLIWKSAALAWPCSNELAWLLHTITQCFHAELKKMKFAVNASVMFIL